MQECGPRWKPPFSLSCGGFSETPGSALRCCAVRAAEEGQVWRRVLLHSQQFAGGEGELHDVAGDGCGIGTGGDFGAAAEKAFQLPVVERRALHGNVVA